MVLSAGPLALLAVLAMGFVAIWLATRGVKTRGKKLWAGLLAALIIVLILTWDVIAGHARFKRLCATESGIRIYKRVDLSSEYSNMQVPDASWSYERMPISKRYKYSSESSENMPGPGRIKYTRDVIRDAETGELLGTFTSYFWGGGWFENTFSPQGAGGGNCGYRKGDFKAFLEKIFHVPQ